MIARGIRPSRFAHLDSPVQAIVETGPLTLP